MTSAENPYFARAAVNRLWAYFFGTGLIDPVDEMVGGERDRPAELRGHERVVVQGRKA